MSGGVDRLWRPAAQRQVRNAWAALHAQRSEWAAASSAAFAAASALVNVFLSHRYIATMDLGVLQDMEAICNKAGAKMERQQEMYLEQLLAKFDDQVRALSGIQHASKSMRTYQCAAEGPFITFSDEPSIEGDAGDGAGAPVFASLPLTVFEMLADEIVAMYEAELKLKWLLASEFRALVFPEAQSSLSRDSMFDQSAEPVSQNVPGKTNVSGLPDLLAKSEFARLGWGQVEDILKKRSKGDVRAESLQVYLTALLIEVNIYKKRIEDIIATVTDEMTVPPPPSSPTRPAAVR